MISVIHEYKRNGTVNIFMMVDAHQPWRHAKVTDHSANVDFAECMRDHVHVHDPNASRIRVVARIPRTLRGVARGYTRAKA